MPLSANLFSSILAMYSYNRGPGPELGKANWPGRPVMRRRDAITGAAAMAGALLTGCERGGYTLHYRLTVEVAVGDKIVVGKAVRALRWHERDPAWAGMDASGFYTRGEAVVVDLGPRGLLVVTLQGWWRNPPSDPPSVNPNTWTPVAALEPVLGPDRARWGSRAGVPADVPPEDMPVMVTFADPRVPGSVRAVDPANLAASFGPGVSLRSVKVEITHDGVTHGPILRALPWLKTWGVRSLDGQGGISSTRLENNLAPASFLLERG